MPSLRPIYVMDAFHFGHEKSVKSEEFVFLATLPMDFVIVLISVVLLLVINHPLLDNTVMDDNGGIWWLSSVLWVVWKYSVNGEKQRWHSQIFLPELRYPKI